MKRKLKALLMILIFFVLILPISANDQRSYPSDDVVIDLIRNLYISVGKGLPSTSGPWTHDELMFMMDRIDRDRLEEPERNLYDAIIYYLSDFSIPSPEENLEFGVNIFSRIMSYTHTNPGDFDHVDKWGVPGYRVPVPVITAELSIGFYDKLFLFMNPAIGLVRNYANPDSMKNAYSFTNMILLPPAKTLDTSANTPQRAYTSLGGHGWNILLGREKVEWGPGHTGNFIFGDHIPYHDMLRINAYTGKFKYTFISSFLIHPQNYFSKIGTNSKGCDVYGYNPYFGQSSWMNGISMYMHHRFEWRILENLNLSLSEGILYQHPENYLDLRVFNPMMIFHNLYMKQYSNSLLNIDLDWTIVPGVNWYSSLVIDDIALPFIENNEEVKGSASPNAIGFLTGLNLVDTRTRGYWTGNVEVAYTDPYLYLRDRGLANAELKETDDTYGLSFITGIREYATEQSSRYDLVWLGYKHGGDAIVTSADFMWSDYNGWGVGGSLFYMAHGVNDILSRWRPTEIGKPGEASPSTGHNGSEDYFPTITGKGDGEVITPHKDTDSVSHTFIVGIEGYYSIAWNIIVNGRLDLVTIWNPENISSNRTRFDSQLTIGITLSL